MITWVMYPHEWWNSCQQIEFHASLDALVKKHNEGMNAEVDVNVQMNVKMKINSRNEFIFRSK